MAAEQYIRVSTEKISKDIYELRIDGFLDFSNSEQVEQAIAKIFQEGIYKIVANLSQTKYISSAGFGCFIASIDTAIKHNGDIIFTSTPKEIEEIFQILGLSRILRFAKDREEAVKTLSALKAA